MDKLAFLDAGHEPANADVQPENPGTEPPVSEPQGGQPRDEHGRFVSPNAGETQEPQAQPQPQQQPEPQPTQQDNTQPPPGYVPVSVVAALRDEIRQLRQQPQQQQQQPDIFEDPDAAIQQHLQPVTQQITDLKLEWSRRLSEKEYGAEVVQQAEQWAVEQSLADPLLAQRIINSPDPYGATVAEFKKHQVLSKLSDPSRIDAFLAWEAAQKQAAAQQQTAPQPQPAPAPAGASPNPMPTRSLATAPSSGGVQHIPTGPGQAFDTVFTR